MHYAVKFLINETGSSSLTSHKAHLFLDPDSYTQAVTIRLPDCPGQPLFGLDNHDLQKNCPTGQVQIET